jgi:hypothetical protein
MSEILALTTEVTKFKQWQPPYAQRNGEWECDYEQWNDLWTAAKSAIFRFKDGDIPDDVANDLIFAIARDNETEIIREHLTEFPLLLSKLAKHVVPSQEKDAKWQIALSVSEAKLYNAADLIRPFLFDEYEYVRRRSLMAIAPFSPSEAEEIAITNLHEKYEYTRIAALHVLHMVDSPKLKECLEFLESDPSEYVRQNVQRLSSAIA